MLTAVTCTAVFATLSLWCCSELTRIIRCRRRSKPLQLQEEHQENLPSVRHHLYKTIFLIKEPTFCVALKWLPFAGSRAKLGPQRLIRAKNCMWQTRLPTSSRQNYIKARLLCDKNLTLHEQNIKNYLGFLCFSTFLRGAPLKKNKFSDACDCQVVRKERSNKLAPSNNIQLMMEKNNSVT